MRTKLTIDDLCGDIKKEYEGKYQALLNNFRNENKEAQNYREDIKNQKLRENEENARGQARSLKDSFDKDMLQRVKDKKAKIELKNSKEKVENIDDIFADKDNGKMLKTVYNAINNNSLLTMATNMLNENKPDMLLELIKNNPDNKTLLNYIKGLEQNSGREGEATIMNAIEDANRTELDDVKDILGAVNLHAIQMDQIYTRDVFPHDIQKEITNQYAKNLYFNGKEDEGNNPYFK